METSTFWLKLENLVYERESSKQRNYIYLLLNYIFMTSTLLKAFPTSTRIFYYYYSLSVVGALHNQYSKLLGKTVRRERYLDFHVNLSYIPSLNDSI